MVDVKLSTFRIGRKRLSLIWFLLALVGPFLAFCFYMIITFSKPYPDLSEGPVFLAIIGFLWVGLFAEFSRHTTGVKLGDTSFTIQKFCQRSIQFQYDSILAHNERHKVDNNGRFMELTVYLKGNYFILQSNEFDQYDLLKNQFVQYGKAISYQKVMTRGERNRLRWLIVGLALLIGSNIAFAYLAHNPVGGKQPAPLTPITAVVDQVHEDRPKSILHGVVLSLRSYPTFRFYVSRRNFISRLDTLRWQIERQQPITLQIRASDYQKKIQKTEPLTFGDKYDAYNQIMVYGLVQGTHIRLHTYQPVFEPVHTNLIQRTLFLGFLLIFCLTGWIYVDQYKVLRPN